VILGRIRLSDISQLNPDGLLDSLEAESEGPKESKMLTNVSRSLSSVVI